jgi:hypothetical protein
MVKLRILQGSRFAKIYAKPAEARVIARRPWPAWFWADAELVFVIMPVVSAMGARSPAAASTASKPGYLKAPRAAASHPDTRLP